MIRKKAEETVSESVVINVPIADLSFCVFRGLFK